jgi:succinate dehydrogenase / fumarate reductase iron-sulfur subunit
MVAQLEAEVFGSCTNYGECEAVCPKGIPITFIARLNRDWLRSAFRAEPEAGGGGAG